MQLQDVCQEIIQEVDGALGCALVDVETGLSLAAKIAPRSLIDAGAMEFMAAASVSYFQGGAIRRLERALSPEAGRPEPAFVQEIQMTTADSCHFISIVPGWDEALLILITDRTVNLGLGWMCVRNACARLRDVRQGERSEAREGQQSHPASKRLEIGDGFVGTLAPVPRESAENALARGGGINRQWPEGLPARFTRHSR